MQLLRKALACDRRYPNPADSDGGGGGRDGGATVTTVGVVTAAYPAGGWLPLMGRFRRAGQCGADEGRARSGRPPLFHLRGRTVRSLRLGHAREWHEGSSRDGPRRPNLVELPTPAGSHRFTQVDGCEAVAPLRSPVSRRMDGRTYESMLLDPQGTWTITDNCAWRISMGRWHHAGHGAPRAATDGCAPGRLRDFCGQRRRAGDHPRRRGTNTNLLGAARGPTYLANGARPASGIT